LLAKNNIQTFHERQKPKDLEPQETSKWVYCSKQFRAIEKVWLYIPGGTAPLFSTVLMLGIPAIIAGCKDIKICTPVNKYWKIAPEILYTAKILWIQNIFKIGWAQAIFAMAYGTEQVWKVDKIFWPGNAFVTEAKMKVSKFCAIDMPAWPSEVLVIADDFSNPKYVAADLLSQCEHGKDSQSVLICNDAKKINTIIKEIQKQLKKLPRKDIATQSLKNSFAILVDNIYEAINISNKYAPEHLILQVKSWEQYISNIINAWSVFCWEYSPESAWDYCSGTNHTLPTNWFAKSYSGIWLESFGKWITFQELTKEWLKNIWSSIEKMASSEWLMWHKNAVSIRF
jgi:histidinol dehydrogenase